MKRWVVILAVILLTLLLIGYLYDQGYLQNLQWQGLSMLAAALAGPYIALKNWLFSKNSTLTEILDDNQATIEKEKVHRVEIDTELAERERKITALDKEVELLDSKIKLLDKKKELIEKEVQDMSLIETKNEAQRLFGE